MRRRISVRQLTFCAVIAALYAGLTISTLEIAYGPIQFRVAEALCVLPYYFPVSVWGLFIGCALANIFSTVSALDIVIGSLATLIAGFAVSRCRLKWLAPLPPVIVNGLMVGLMLAYVMPLGGFWLSFAVYAAQVALGELLVMYLLGLPLLLNLPKLKPLMDYLNTMLSN